MKDDQTEAEQYNYGAEAARTAHQSGVGIYPSLKSDAAKRGWSEANQALNGQQSPPTFSAPHSSMPLLSQKATNYLIGLCVVALGGVGVVRVFPELLHGKKPVASEGKLAAYTLRVISDKPIVVENWGGVKDKTCIISAGTPLLAVPRSIDTQQLTNDKVEPVSAFTSEPRLVEFRNNKTMLERVGRVRQVYVGGICRDANRPLAWETTKRWQELSK